MAYQKRKLIQQIRNSSNIVVACSGNIPHDNTIPQNTEGTEVITTTITPTSSSSSLLIEFFCFACNDAISGNWLSIALFQDSTADALTASSNWQYGGNYGVMNMIYKMSAGTTSSTTFKIRMGKESSTLYVNGTSTGASIFGDIGQYSLTVTEFL